MRETLFRGFHPCDGPDTIVVDWEKVKGRWVEGYYVAHTDCCHFIIPIPFGGYIVADNTFYAPDAYMVLPSTVGQYTGLKDKAGNRIFEGDVVEGYDFSAEDGYGVVQWDDGAFEVTGNDICGTFHENYWGQEFEIIGTIWDEEVHSEQT